LAFLDPCVSVSSAQSRDTRPYFIMGQNIAVIEVRLAELNRVDEARFLAFGMIE
jgi:hypothetical protein